MTFEKYVKKVIEETVRQHQHPHPLYEETRVVKSIVDEKNKRAAFVLFEQIDTDRLFPESEGWLGDQYRYSIWYIKGYNKPKQIYEDHAWKRRSVSLLTGTSGRDPYIDLEELLEDGVIATLTPEKTQKAFGKLSQVRVKITLDGKIEEPENFRDKAENLIKKIGPKLGYDWLSQYEEIKGKKIAGIVWGAENGSNYGFDTVYLVWEDKKGKMHYKEITNSRYDQNYLYIQELKERSLDIILKINNEEYKVSKRELVLED